MELKSADRRSVERSIWLAFAFVIVLVVVAPGSWLVDGRYLPVFLGAGIGFLLALGASVHSGASDEQTARLDCCVPGLRRGRD